MSLNKVMFIGHLGRDPEVRYLSNGDPVCNFSVAASERWKDKDGEQQERTEWLRCNAWGKLAEICGEYLKKGSLVYVEGSLNTRKWTDKDGVEKYATECRVSGMKMLGGRSSEEGSQAPAPRAAPAQQRQQAPAKSPSSGFDDMDDDVPF